MTYIIGFFVALYLVLRINKLEERVNKLTSNQGVPVQARPQVASIQPSHTAQATQAQQGPQTLHATAPHVAPAPQAVSAQPHATQPTPQSPSQSSAQPLYQPIQPTTQPLKAKTADDHSEFKFGSQVLTTVGIVAVLLGVIFFLRYAFDTGLITEGMRIFLGYISGLAFVVVGYFLRAKYQSYGTGLTGGGLGIFYITTYAAFEFYGIISQPAAFALFIGITALGACLAIAYNSMPIIMFSLLGGFLVPLIFPLTDSVHVLFPYLIILNLAVLLIARFKAWPKLTVVSLIATGLLGLTWVVSYKAQEVVQVTFVYVTILFLIYFATSFINFLVRDRDYKGIDAFLVYVLPVFYFSLCSPLIETREGYAIFALVVGVFYLVMSLVLRTMFNQSSAMSKCSNIMMVIGSLYLIIATALHFEGNITTIMFAAEAILMVVSGVMFRARATRILGIVLAAFVGIISLGHIFEDNFGTSPIFNEMTFTVWFSILMFAIIWYVYKLHLPKRNQLENSSATADNVDESESNAGRGIGAVGVAGLVFLWISSEPLRLLTGETNVYLPMLWSLYALVFIAISFWAKEFVFRVIAYVVMGLGVLMLIVNSWALDVDYAFILNTRVLSTIVIVIVMSMIIAMMKMNRDQLRANPNQVFAVCYLIMNGLILWAGSLEIIDYFNNKARVLVGARPMYDSYYPGEEITAIENTKRVVLSLYWLGYSMLGLTYGILKKSHLVRMFTIGLLSITVVKIFIYDTANLSDVYRFISFISLGVILLVAGFAYYRFKDRIIGLVKSDDINPTV